MTPNKAFYLNSKNVKGDTFYLDDHESHHLTQVLRTDLSEKIYLLDGAGKGYVGQITSIENKIVYGKIVETIIGLGENTFSLNIVPALTKGQRFESLIEKVTELGIKEIHPIITNRCIKKSLNINRCRRIIKASAKQCNRSFFPKLLEPVDLNMWLKDAKGKNLVGMQKSENRLSGLRIKKGENINILIGPEGDFDNDEHKLLKDRDAEFYTLSDRRLRSDTAAQATISVLNELLT